MAKEVPWTKIILETFLEESGINDRIKLGDDKARILDGIMRTRVAGWNIIKQAEEFHISVDTVNKYIKELKNYMMLLKKIVLFFLLEKLLKLKMN